ncbi:hypothetical protein [Bacillus atrophaeus]|uniref:hypothetical protein n=1 Tax=Bacillus atrophaeus TaxID=1452 RepID=UPI002E1FBDF7|nr:hypothetical protein [Bacillus atrophaeus]MED1032492.1 hypothetical protein [Bacillus atrophaeus]MED1120961.1 hypothetical protein [Bacillus atrophaeus]
MESVLDMEKLSEWKTAFCIYIYLLDSKKLPLPLEALKWNMDQLYLEIKLLLEE